MEGMLGGWLEEGWLEEGWLGDGLKVDCREYDCYSGLRTSESWISNS